MATDIFSVTAPLVIRLPSGEKRVMAERFPHPKGLLYFEPFWRDNEFQPAVHLAEGEIKGDGPWKIGDAVITVLSCGDAELNMEWNNWQQFVLGGGIYADPEATREVARANGANV
jgi:hypothetical protein